MHDDPTKDDLVFGYLAEGCMDSTLTMLAIGALIALALCGVVARALDEKL